jgi:hypothetical protein
LKVFNGLLSLFAQSFFYCIPLHNFFVSPHFLMATSNLIRHWNWAIWNFQNNAQVANIKLFIRRLNWWSLQKATKTKLTYRSATWSGFSVVWNPSFWCDSTPPRP